MTAIPRLLPLSLLLLCPFIPACGDPAAAAPSSPAYADWIASHIAPTNDNPLLVINIVFGSSTDAPFNRTIIHQDGTRMILSWSGIGASVIHPSARFSPATLAALQSLLDKLPDDLQILPPPDRRLLLQFHRAGAYITRVYDRATLTDDTLDILRYTDSSFGSWTPALSPDSNARLNNDFFFDGGTAVSPNGTRMVAVAPGQPLRVWDTTAPQPIATLFYKNMSASSIAFSPDGAFAITTSRNACNCFETFSWTLIHRFEPAGPFNGAGFFDPIFTPDGNYLLLNQDHLALAAYDLHSWHKVPLPDFIPSPDQISAYHPSPDGSIALVQMQNGDMTLWNPTTKTFLGLLPSASRRWLSAFSPDSKTLALAYLPADHTHEGTGYVLTLFRTTDGAPLHTLLRNDITPFPLITSLLWSHDNQHLFVASGSPSTINDITLFNPATGRHEATLSPYPSGRPLSFALLPNHQLVTNIGGALLEYYDLPRIYSKIIK